MGWGKWVAGGALLGAVLAGTISYHMTWGHEGFFTNTAGTWFKPPWSQTKVLAVASAALMLPALVLGLLEWRADREWRHELAALRASDLAADVVEYEGPEGTGVLLLGAHRRALLLRPLGGLGRPRVVELPLAGAIPPAPQA